ncbi:hypothetical protein [uncultured Methylobacterium sp.]|uniref:hypothetical protein n=1 Tax=uncultured Methylobacterium sp. TaxID=157278 RepID=UPI00259518C9|nr:hypothetical protein [uncultured Methylobacterium sp.]
MRWLTLNSHVPIRAGEATARHDCATGGPFGDPEVCAMAEIGEDPFAAESPLASRDPEAELFLVGDHAPPLRRRAARIRFEPDRGPLIRLTPRSLVNGIRHQNDRKPAFDPISYWPRPSSSGTRSTERWHLKKLG